MSEEEPALAPCGFGAFGSCCCTCVHHAETVQWISGQSTKGYACLVFLNSDKESMMNTIDHALPKKLSPVVIGVPLHGACEAHLYHSQLDPV